MTPGPTPIDALLATHLRKLEESLLDPQIRKSPVVGELLHDEFFEIGKSGGSYSKQEAITALQTEQALAFEISEFRVSLLAENTALLTYRANRNSDPTVSTLRASVWQNSPAQQWKLIFHHGNVAAELQRSLEAPETAGATAAALLGVGGRDEFEDSFHAAMKFMQSPILGRLADILERLYPDDGQGFGKFRERK